MDVCMRNEEWGDEQGIKWGVVDLLHENDIWALGSFPIDDYLFMASIATPQSL